MPLPRRACACCWVLLCVLTAPATPAAAAAAGVWVPIKLADDGKGFDTHDPAGCKAAKGDDGGIPMCSVRDSHSILVRQPGLWRCLANA